MLYWPIFDRFESPTPLIGRRWFFFPDNQSPSSLSPWSWSSGLLKQDLHVHHNVHCHDDDDCFHAGSHLKIRSDDQSSILIMIRPATSRWPSLPTLNYNLGREFGSTLLTRRKRLQWSRWSSSYICSFRGGWEQVAPQGVRWGCWRMDLLSGFFFHHFRHRLVSIFFAIVRIITLKGCRSVTVHLKQGETLQVNFSNRSYL